MATPQTVDIELPQWQSAPTIAPWAAFADDAGVAISLATAHLRMIAFHQRSKEVIWSVDQTMGVPATVTWFAVSGTGNNVVTFTYRNTLQTIAAQDLRYELWVITAGTADRLLADGAWIVKAGVRDAPVP